MKTSTCGVQVMHYFPMNMMWRIIDTHDKSKLDRKPLRQIGSTRKSCSSSAGDILSLPMRLRGGESLQGGKPANWRHGKLWLFASGIADPDQYHSQRDGNKTAQHLDEYEEPMQQSKDAVLLSLWRARDKGVPRVAAELRSIRGLGYWPRILAGLAAGAQRQRRRIQPGELLLGKSDHSVKKHVQKCFGDLARPADDPEGRDAFGGDNAKVLLRTHQGRVDSGASTVRKTNKREKAVVSNRGAA